MTVLEKQQMIRSWVVLIVSAIAYSGIAGAFTFLTDGDRKFFFIVIGCLIALRLFYEVLEVAVGIAVWRLYGRRVAVENYVKAMRDARMPRRYYSTDDVGNYLARIQNGYSYEAGKVTPEALNTAKEFDRVMGSVREQSGMIAEARTWDAIKRAYESYTTDDSPPWVTPGLQHWFQKITQHKLLYLPYITPELAGSLLRDRPFDSIHSLWDYLRSHGFDKNMASAFFVAASCHSEGKPTPDEVIESMKFFDSQKNEQARLVVTR